MDMQTKRAALRAMEALIADQALVLADRHPDRETLAQMGDVQEFFHLVDQYAKLLRVRVRGGREG